MKEDIFRKVSWWNLEKKREKSGKKIFSKYHKNLVHSQFDPCGFKKMVSWPLDGALAQESKNKLKSAEKNAGTPGYGLFYFFIWKRISFYIYFWKENWCFRMLLKVRGVWIRWYHGALVKIPRADWLIASDWLSVTDKKN